MRAIIIYNDVVIVLKRNVFYKFGTLLNKVDVNKYIPGTLLFIVLKETI